MASFECVFTSDASGQLWNTCVWDIVSGSVLMQYKGGTSSPRTLCLLGSDYLLSGQTDKPVLRVWSLQRRDQLQKQIVCPGKVTALAASPDGLHCAAGIQEKIYIWQTSSGDLLAVLSRHFRPVSCIRFSDDGSRLVSASRDGQVLAWDLGDAVSSTHGTGEPLHVWAQHSFDVTDVWLGLGGGARCRVYTCSLDQTCRAYAMDSGELLATAVLDAPLTALAADPAEDHLFAAANTGKIYQVALYKWSGDTGRPKATFVGHESKVTCLSISMDGQLLASGSEDRTARIWDVLSKQCIHVLHHQGPLTNILIVPTPAAIAQSGSFSTETVLLPLGVFKRSMQAARDTNGVALNLSSVSRATLPSGRSRLNGVECSRVLSADLEESGGVEGGERSGEEDFGKQVSMLKQVNRELYNYAWNCVLRQQEPPCGSSVS